MKKITTNKKEHLQWAGNHMLLEFWQCQNLNSEKIVKKALVESVAACRAELLSVSVHCFKPHGISGIAAIKESHISIHTWPEKRYAAIDIFTCGTKVKPFLAMA